jgi:choloylglycine hydrolase
MKPLAAIAAAVLAVLTGLSPARPCSVFTAHDAQTVLAGNNEDYYGGDPTIIWFVPPENGKYGFVAWGFQENHFSQGGMNDQGLFWDGMATAALEITNDTGTKPFTITTLEEVMQVSATVDEAITALREYQLSGVLGSAQLMFADRFGNSAIFEGDEVIYPAGDYQVGTNFLNSHPELGGHPCWRYDTLTAMMESGLELTVAYFTEMADAVHQGTEVGPGIYTRYTTIGDLVEGMIYLYMDLDYDNYVLIDLAAHMARGSPHEYRMSDLFISLPDGGDQDAGMDAGIDAGTDAGDQAAADVGGDVGADVGGDLDAGTVDAGEDPGDNGGCNCGSTGSPGLLLLLLLPFVRKYS